MKCYMKQLAGMAEGKPKSDEEDTDIDVDELTETVSFERMMADLDTVEMSLVRTSYLHVIISS